MRHKWSYSLPVEYDHLDVHYLELRRFANVAIINGGSTESVYGICIVYDGIWCPTFFWGTRRMCKQCVPGPLLSFIYRAWERGYIVRYDGFEFPGEITSCGETDAEVNVMHRSGSAWRWPTNPDKTFYEHANIL